MDIQPNPPFDEQAALAELERLRGELQAARKRREEMAEQFDAFVRSFQSPESRDAPPPAATSLRATSGRVARTADFAPTAVFEPVVPIELDGGPPVVAVRWKRGFGVARLAAAVAITGAVLLVALLFFRGGPSTGTEPRAASSAPTPAPVPPTRSEPAPTPAAAAAPQPQAAPAPPAALTAELIAVRPVWVRVIVDGRRTMQRQLAAGERVPLRAEKVINLRAGDAGALRLVVDGRDQGVLGRDGAIATRALMHAAK
ncbi:MAG TPA: DUF4115 domain-containing protein [Vicinamibacterales bacterium]|jgi:hypothetical protein|nr:DUF4115 domain-containing protein [Vicinamibacterales bacterium]